MENSAIGEHGTEAYPGNSSGGTRHRRQLHGHDDGNTEARTRHRGTTTAAKQPPGTEAAHGPEAEEVDIGESSTSTAVAARQREHGQEEAGHARETDVGPASRRRAGPELAVMDELEVMDGGRGGRARDAARNEELGVAARSSAVRMAAGARARQRGRRRGGGEGREEGEERGRAGGGEAGLDRREESRCSRGG